MAQLQQSYQAMRQRIAVTRLAQKSYDELAIEMAQLERKNDVMRVCLETIGEDENTPRHVRLAALASIIASEA